MLSQIAADFKLHKKYTLFSLLFFPGCFILGILVVSLISSGSGDDESVFFMGTLMTLMVLFFSAVYFALQYSQGFVLALSMGRTRKEFLLSYAVQRLVWALVGYLMILGLYQLEQTIYKWLFPLRQAEFYMIFITKWWFVVMVLLCTPILHMFFGALSCRFGQKAGLILFFVLVYGIALPMINIGHENGPSPVLVFLSTVPTAVWIALAVVVTIAMLVTVIQLGRKQQVR